ncbi:VPS10 domain-containing protein [Reichenbachiella versicolor]|uniref:VPS10 domain-containing protein n=1 Tax=Reichenbachiella versicolor TaxID=1821036 RepID=UPI000D6E7ADA|nr:T9SS type A sorting domain-containing protein [Reichenbachiella versicolor]
MIRLILAMLMLPTMVWADETIFTSGFESNFSNEWRSTLAQGGALLERSNAHSSWGDYSARIKLTSSNQKVNFNTPKTIDWEAGKKYTISFKWYSPDPSDNTASMIKLFDNGGNQIGISNIDWNQTGWAKYSFEFTPTVNANNGYILFTFRPNSANKGEYYIDGIKVLKETGSAAVTDPTFNATQFFSDLKTKNIASKQSVKWTQFGPGMSGNNKCAFWHPTDPNVLFIAPNMHNTYRSTNKGKTYHSVMNDDAPGFNTGLRGPVEFAYVDFSRQDEKYGFATVEKNFGLYQTTNKGKSWRLMTELNSTFGGAYLACVTPRPDDDKVWYVGAGRMRDFAHVEFPKSDPHGIWVDENSQGKIWVSNDRGVSWTLSATGLHPKAEVETIIVDPVKPWIVYVSTNYGFYKSTNKGANWTKFSSGLDHDVIKSMTMHHDEETGQVTLYVLNNITWKADGNTVTDHKGGVFKSTDRGATWENITGDLALDMTQFRSNHAVKKSYYNTVAFYFGITVEEAKSRFSELPTKITQRFNEITVDPNDPDNLYMNNMYSNSSTNNFLPGQIWRTKNGGDHWFVTFRNGINWNKGDDVRYWRDRGNPVGTNITLRYLHQWVDRDAYDRKSCNFTRFNADGSVLHTQMAKISLMSYDGGDTWVDIDDRATGTANSWVGAGNSNLPGHGFYQHPDIPNKVFCAAGENSLWVTNDEGENVRAGAQGATAFKFSEHEQSLSSYAIHPSNTNVHFALFFRQHGGGEFFKSTNGGTTWNKHGVAIEKPWPASGGGDQSIHQMNLTIDYNNPKYMYFNVPKKSKNVQLVGNSVGSHGVHRTTDGGETWEEINSGLPTSRDVTAIAMHPTNPKVLYAAVQGGNGGLYKTTNRGNSWTEVASTASISGDFGINDIHFAKDGKVYISSGYKGADADEGGLWMSSDELVSWTQIFDFPWTYRVETALTDPKTILLSTLSNTTIGERNAGTYLSKDSGTSWIKINTGNGQSDRINDIAIDNSNPNKFYASTYGSGWYAGEYIPSSGAASGAREVTEEQSSENTIIEEIVEEPQILVYPNPAKGYINIAGLEKGTVSIYTFLGDLVKQSSFDSEQSISTAGLEAGLYLVKVSGGKSSVQIKLVIE